MEHCGVLRSTMLRPHSTIPEIEVEDFSQHCRVCVVVVGENIC